MNIGWTGSRHTTRRSLELIADQLAKYKHKEDWIITGGCIGVDAAVARMATLMSFRVHVILPWNREFLDSHWEEHCTTHLLMPAGSSYMARNDKIIQMSEILEAFPLHEKEELRSGTWSTIRRGWKRGIIVNIHAIGK